MHVVSVQVGRAKVYSDTAGGHRDPVVWHSGIVKSMVLGPVRLHELGFAGDEQADQKHHGGPDKAVLAYAAQNYDKWQRELQQHLPAGGFGENLTVSGLFEETVCIGDRFQIGTAILEVSQTRIPCWKINRRWRSDDLLDRVRQNGRTGWYLRVLHPGVIEALDAIKLLERPHPDWTISRVNDVIHGRLRTESAWRELALLRELADSQREIVQAKFRTSLNSASDKS